MFSTTCTKDKCSFGEHITSIVLCHLYVELNYQASMLILVKCLCCNVVISLKVHFIAICKNNYSLCTPQKAQGEWTNSSIHSKTLHLLEVGGQLQSPVALHPVSSQQTVQWVTELVWTFRRIEKSLDIIGNQNSHRTTHSLEQGW